MKGKIYLDTRKDQELKGGFYPLKVELTGLGKQKRFSLKMKFQKQEWDFLKQEPGLNKTKQLVVRKKKSLLDSLLLQSLDDVNIDYDYIKSKLLGNHNKINSTSTKIDFIEIGYDLANELKKIKNSKGIFKEGNAKVYENVLNQFKKFKPSVLLNELDYETLVQFKNEQLIAGNKKNTVHSYLRTLRAIYNEALRRAKLKLDHSPFEGVFKDIHVKKNRTKKRNISKEAIRILESLNNNLANGQQKAVDLFLLQFYFGGQDLVDIFYLEKSQISNSNRVYFTRGKLDDGGYEFDLNIFTKTKFLLNKYRGEDDTFYFPWRKDPKGYITFRSRLNRDLKLIQYNYNEHISRIEKLNGKTYHKLEVLPLSGNITTKVARHTFATIGSRLYVEPDLLRALMGHERDDVDTIYKDVYPEEERDYHHKMIIDTKDIQVSKMYVYNLEFFNENKVRSWKYKYFQSIPTEQELEDNLTFKKYTKPRFFKEIFLIEK
ncbi:tyrosine-type recombinase/integrase [Tenacibaculum geojense]|uniref:Tyrosine-type recombinase/integrase n=1 Tax=Tenacibaculum geojense TaxID=915352 RepID=A0ABW3JQJ6_9FLAO